MPPVFLPIRTVSEANTHEHWRGRHKRAKEQRRITLLLLRHTLGNKPPPPPVVVTLTRLAPSAGLDRHDNLRASLKSTADGVQDYLGVNDRDIDFRYAQERAPTYGVRVSIEPATAQETGRAD